MTLIYSDVRALITRIIGYVSSSEEQEAETNAHTIAHTTSLFTDDQEQEQRSGQTSKLKGRIHDLVHRSGTFAHHLIVLTRDCD